jgi:hypothetical protein
MGGVPGFLCRSTGLFFIANNSGAKKSGVLLCGNFENMGGVYAVIYNLFVIMPVVGMA